MKKRLRKIIFICTFLLMILIVSISCLSNYFGKRVEDYGKQEATKKGSEIISLVINEEVLSLLDLNNLVSYNENKIIINAIQINKIIKEANNTLVNKTSAILIDEIVLPYSILFSEILFPWKEKGLKVKIKPISSYNIDVISDVTEYGINNSLFTIHLVVKINVQILIPFNNEEVEVISKIPLVMQVIQGDVPYGLFYGSNIN